MFKKILVPLDGSVRAEQAIPVAARIARVYDSSIVLLQVAYPPVAYEAYSPKSPAITETALEAELTEDTNYLEIRADSGDLAGIKTEIQALVGLPASTILSFVKSLPADLIVMSSHGYTGLKRWMLGSVADKLVRHASVPVLVLRDEGSVSLVSKTEADRPLRALVALDGSSLSEAVLEPTAYIVAALAAPRQGALHLVQVVNLPPTYRRLGHQGYFEISMIEQAELEAKAYLRMIADRLFEGPLADLQLAVTTSAVNDPDVAGALIEEAEDKQEVDDTGAIHGCDLIAITTHGRGGLERWAVGSITERVLHATKLPLLVARPKKQAPPEFKSEKTADAASMN